VIERQLPAKERHVEPLTVVNWLHKPQRFRVKLEKLAGDRATRLEGGEHIDVPAKAERQYNLAFYSYTQVSMCEGVCMERWVVCLIVVVRACVCVCVHM
jgi:hypothetical protein